MRPKNTTLAFLSLLLLGCNPTAPPATTATPPSETPRQTTILPTASPAPEVDSWNLAYDQPIEASSWQEGFPPEMAVNGLYTPREDPPDCWAFEQSSPAWIEVELPQDSVVDALELIVGPEADLQVEVFGRGSDDELEPLRSVDFVPNLYGVAVYDFPQPLENMRSIRLDFPEVPPSWCLPELGVMGWQVEKIPPDGIKSPMCLAAPDLIFHNANVITMDDGQPSAEAVAVEGERIVAVGADRDLLPGAGCSRTIDLQGQTLMPGLIEGHSHTLHFPDRAGFTRDEAVDTLLRFGVTTVNELVASQEFIEDLMRMEAEGRLRVRVNAYPNYNAGYLDESGTTIIQQVWYQEHPPTLDLER